MKKLSANILGIIFCLSLFSLTAFNPVKISAAPIFELPPEKIFFPSATPTPTIKIFKIPPKVFLGTGTVTPTLTPTLTITPTVSVTPTISLTPSDTSPTSQITPSISPEQTPSPTVSDSFRPLFTNVNKREIGLAVAVILLVLAIGIQRFWPQIKKWLHIHTA